MTVIHLVRHGQASFGQANYDQLSELGVTQSRHAGEALNAQLTTEPVIVCGEMQRHKQTAEAALQMLRWPSRGTTTQSNALQDTCAWHTDGGFNEYPHPDILAADWPLARNPADMRAWLKEQAEPRAAFREHFNRALLRWQRDDDAYQERWPDFRQRVLNALHALPEKHAHPSDIIVFTSAGAISVILLTLLGQNDDALLTWNRTLVNSAITRILFTQDGPQVLAVNEHQHLPPTAITYR